MTRGSLHDALSSMPRWLLEVLCHGLLVAIGFVDYATGPELSLALLYLFPVFTVTWALGRTRGLVMSLLAALAWLLAHAGIEGVLFQSSLMYWNAVIRLGFFVVVALLGASVRQAVADREKLAGLDFLTGLANARSLFESARLEMERARRYHHPISVAYVDVDGFKSINDEHGHVVGNGVLRDVAEAMCASVRSTDLVARVGGDEFVIVFTETGPDNGLAAARKVHEGVRDTMRRKGWSITISVGLVTFLTPPASVLGLLKTADDLMYSAKRNGRDSIRAAVVRDTAPVTI